MKEPPTLALGWGRGGPPRTVREAFDAKRSSSFRPAMRRWGASKVLAEMGVRRRGGDAIKV